MKQRSGAGIFGCSALHQIFLHQNIASFAPYYILFPTFAPYCFLWITSLQLLPTVLEPACSTIMLRCTICKILLVVHQILVHQNVDTFAFINLVLVLLCPSKHLLLEYVWLEPFNFYRAKRNYISMVYIGLYCLLTQSSFPGLLCSSSLTKSMSCCFHRTKTKSGSFAKS